MSDAQYETAPAEPESSETEKRARQLAQFVEAERKRRRAALGFYLALLLVPVGLAAAGLVLARKAAPISEDALRSQLTPIVEVKVGEQMQPMVEEKFGGKIDTVIEQRVGEKIQGASPAKVRELGESVEQVRRDLTQVQAGVQEVQEVRASLPQIREQLTAQVQNIQRIETRVAQMPPPNTNPELASEVKRLQERIGGLESHLNRSLESLSVKVNENSRTVKALSVRVNSLRGASVPEKEGGREKNNGNGLIRKQPR